MKIELKVNGFPVIAQYDDENIEHIFFPLLLRWAKLQKQYRRRIFVFLAAPPGCGKTTLSLFLEYLSHQKEGLTHIQTIGMDGFHHDNDYLNHHMMIEDGKEMLMRKRKGGPMTFDVEKLAAKLKEARNCDNLWPIYSRELHEPIENAIQIQKKIVLLEGNYLLSGRDDWAQLLPYCDDSVFINADASLLQERLIKRKMQGGSSWKDAQDWYENSDKKNIAWVLENHVANIDLRMNENNTFCIEKKEEIIC